MYVIFVPFVMMFVSFYEFGVIHYITNHSSKTSKVYDEIQTSIQTKRMQEKEDLHMPRLAPLWRLHHCKFVEKRPTFRLRRMHWGWLQVFFWNV